MMKEKIKQKAAELGFPKVAFLPVQSLPLWEEGIKRRKAIDPETAGYWEARGLVSDIYAVMGDARTIIAAFYPYQPFRQSSSPEKGYFSAHYKAYPRGHAAMAELGKLLTDMGYHISVDPPVPVKEITYRSGLGKFGKNGLIHNPKYGSLMTLHVMLTNAELKPDDAIPGDISDCGSCRLCIDACPMQAITDNGTVIISRCMRYHMLSQDFIPIEIREKTGSRMLGCEDCQVSCPRNRNAYNKAVNFNESDEIFNIRSILKDHARGLKNHMSLIGETVGRNYARPLRVLSMAVIAAGNSGDPSYIPLLAQTLGHSHPPVRAHSAWAIGKLGGENEKDLLMEARKQEKNPKVIEDIDLAISRIESRKTYYGKS
ncbi:MAG TPA: epoxyqueuosine reductase [Clostridiales bacterium]|nr:epoxyqueuosine reductase [Clostridiales bacterium]